MKQSDHEALDSRDPNSWDACEIGSLSGIARRKQAAVARTRQSKIAGAALLSAAALLLIAFSVTRRGVAPKPEVWGDVYGGIACSQCIDLMPAYRDHLVEDRPMLDVEIVSMATHLAECPKCAKHFNKKYPGVLTSAAPVVTAAVAGLAGLFVLRRRVEDAS